MLINFRFYNYRSFRDETVLSMETRGNSEYKSCLIPYKKKGIFPAAAIFGKMARAKVMRFVYSG